MKTGENRGNDFLIMNWILPQVRCPHPAAKPSQITHIDSLSHTLQLFLRMGGADSCSWHFHIYSRISLSPVWDAKRSSGSNQC